MAARLVELARKNLVRHQHRAVDLLGEVVLEAARKAEACFGRHAFDGFNDGRSAAPADLDTAEQIGLRAGHLEDAARVEMQLVAEDLRVGFETHGRAAAVRRFADFLDGALGVSARIGLPVKFLLARHLDLELFGQCVDDRDADAVQTARGLIHLAVELSARVKRGHDDFEGRLTRKLRVRLNWNAAAIVGDPQVAGVFELHLDEAGVPCHCFVHGVVDDFGKQMMQRLLVGAADIHAGALTDRLKTLEDFNMCGRVAVVTDPTAAVDAWRMSRDGLGSALAARLATRGRRVPSGRRVEQIAGIGALPACPGFDSHGRNMPRRW